MISQKNEWLACPPPLLRTAVLISVGTASISDNNSSTVFRLILDIFRLLHLNSLRKYCDACHDAGASFLHQCKGSNASYA